MKDERIIELLFKRDESALLEAEKKYSRFCHTVAKNLLALREDREECVNDAILALWNNIPPDRPENLAAYLSKIVKNIALNRTRDSNRWKRCANIGLASDEFLSLIPDDLDVAREYESRRAGDVINTFLKSVPEKNRDVFILRYWYGDTVP